MLLSSLFITFLLEYFLTPAEDSFDKYLSLVSIGLEPSWISMTRKSPLLVGCYWFWEVH